MTRTDSEVIRNFKKVTTWYIRVVVTSPFVMYSQYAENMVVKVFLFQFVNSYASFYYVAFAARYAGDCEPKACLTSLAINLATLYISGVTVDNTLELLIPYLKHKYKHYKYIKKNVSQISRPEVEFLLEPVSGIIQHITSGTIYKTISCTFSCAVRSDGVQSGQLLGSGNSLRLQGAVRHCPAADLLLRIGSLAIIEFIET